MMPIALWFHEGMSGLCFMNLSTERLRLGPLRESHAVEIFELLSDDRMYRCWKRGAPRDVTGRGFAIDEWTYSLARPAEHRDTEKQSPP
jgi:hypothetical protein